MACPDVTGAGLGAEAYFVGEVELHRVVSFPLDHVNDAMLQAWLRDGSEGCVEIDLYRYVTLYMVKCTRQTFTSPIVMSTNIFVSTLGM